MARFSRQHIGVRREIAVDSCQKLKRNFHRLFVLNLAKLEFCHLFCSQSEYGDNTKSWFTITRTGKPGRMVSVG